jgi:hypothetical protein
MTDQTSMNAAGADAPPLSISEPECQENDVGCQDSASHSGGC